MTLLTLFEVKFVMRQTPGEGEVQICLNGSWGSVCESNWGYSEARVVCRQLGYDPSRHLCSQRRYLSHKKDATVSKHSNFHHQEFLP